MTRRPAARVGVSIDAPCRRDQNALIRHAGMEFRIRLSGMGRLYFEIPILEENAEIETVFENRETLLGSILMPELKDHARLAVMWEDPDLAELVPGIARGGAGELVTLGEAGAPKLQIFSHPHRTEADMSVARVHILNRITDEACAQPRRGRVLRVQPEQAPIRYDLRLAAPGCKADGGDPVLKNILADLTLTAN
ncbi:MAG: hypothetical protein JXR14_14890 [Paracoccaceae bacterium]